MDYLAFRRKHKMTQNAMARELQVSLAAYLKWEYGSGKPNYFNQLKIDELVKRLEGDK